MTISLFAVLGIIVKIFIFIGICGWLAIFTMWPINDQPTSLTQKIVWVTCCAAAAVLMFTDLIHITL